MANDKLVQPENQLEKTSDTVGEMHKRPEKMADERRYIIYYTFGDQLLSLKEDSAKSENV